MTLPQNNDKAIEKARTYSLYEIEIELRRVIRQFGQDIKRKKILHQVYIEKTGKNYKEQIMKDKKNDRY